MRPPCAIARQSLSQQDSGLCKRSDAAPSDMQLQTANRRLLRHGLRLEWGLVPFRTPGKKDKPLRYARYGIWQRRKSPVRRCFKSRPPFGGVRRFASGCRFLSVVDRPLVRIPAVRHTTTGTCDLGSSEDREIRRYYKCFFRVLQRARLRRCVAARRPRRRGSGAPILNIC